MSFFFSKQAAKKFVDVDLLHKMECKLCPLYNLPGNKNKDIKPNGAAQPQVYILGVGPRDIDDKTGKFYAGVGGQYLKSCFTEQQINKVRYNNITRTKTIDFRPPFEAIEACRPSVEKDILASQPRIILGLGDEVLNWVQKNKVTLSAWRGHPFPVQVLGHTSWFYPTFNPDSILESEVKNKLDPVFKLDIKNLYKFLDRNLEPYVVPKSEIFTNVHILNNLLDIRSALLKLYKEPSTVTDLETTAKDVYESYSKILSFAIGTIDYTISFGYQHPQAPWTPDEFQQLKKLLHWFYKNKKQRKTAHNAGFEISWLVKEFDDPEIAYSNWHDTMSSSYCLEGNSTKVLMADCSWKFLKDVNIGDKILTIEENTKPTGRSDRPKSRRWKIAIVTNKFLHKKKCVKIRTPDGELIGTLDHKALVDAKSNPRISGSPKTLNKLWVEWKDFEYIKNNYKSKLLSLRFLAKPWEVDKSYEAGWLSGIFDGEGWVGGHIKKLDGSDRGGSVVCGFAQNEGLILDQARFLLKSREFSFNNKSISDCKKIEIGGGFKEIVRLLGILQPIRLIQNLPKAINKAKITSQKTTNLSQILDVEEVEEERDVVDISTTEGTFIANGFLVHNCLGYGGNSKESDDGSEKVFKGLLSLDSLVKVHFGFDLKAASNLNRADLIHEDLSKVLLYGGGDTKWTDGVRLKLDADVEYEGLRAIVDEHDRRIPSVALMRRKGLVYDLSRAKTHEADLESKISKIYTESMNHPSAIEYKSKFKKFDIGSPADVANILEYLKFDVYRVNKDGTKKKSSDDGILKAIDHPIAKNVLTYRELTKAKSTYVDIFIPGAGKNYVVYPDGLIHSNFTTHFTTTGRTSSNDPNLQNFPKRKNKDIRDIIVAPPGHIFASADFGQLEYRVLVMATKDQKLVDYVWNGTDIHADWSLRIAKKHPKRVGGVEVVNRWAKAELATLKNTDKLFKAFRDIVKNNFVFAAFYGAGIRKLAQAMVLPENVVKELYEEFWEEFSEVHAWHKWAYEFYAQHGYIETLTGRRRYAPIEGGEIINMPIQGSGSDIVIDGMCRLSEYALATEQPQYQPVLNIHDDLSFYLPEISWQKDLDKIIEIMLDCRYPWINVPLAVEASKGPDWFHQEDYGVYDNSKDLKIRLAV